MTEISGDVERGEMRTPMLSGRFRAWLAMVAFVTILARVLFGYDQGVIAAIGEVATFLLFAVMCVIAFVWIMDKVPETKGKSLEEIQDAWAEHDERQSGPKDPMLQVDLA